MRNIRHFAIMVGALAVVGCSSAKFSYDYAPSADFSKYRTFAWHPGGNNMPNDPRYNSSLVDQQLRDAIGYGLEVAGLEQVESVQDADLVVIYHAITEQRTNYTTVNSYYGYDPWWGPYGGWGGWGMGASTTYARNYDEGTVIVDLLENVPGEKERIVWRSSVTDTIRERGEPRRDREEMRAAGVRLFEDYPPGGSR
jgi:hypothetical protein